MAAFAAAAIPALIAALGTGATMYSQHRANKSQQAATQTAIKRSRTRQKTIGDMLQKQTAAMAPGPRMARLDEAETHIGNELAKSLRDTAQLQAARRVTTGGTTGRVSGAATTRRAKAAAKRGNTQATLARALAAVQAPAELGRQEASGFNQLQQNVGLQNSFGLGDAFVDQARIQGAGQPNPWLSGIGGLAQGVGTGMYAQGYGVRR